MAELSPRAQEILASVERDAAVRRVSLAVVPDPGSAADAAGRPGDPSRLLALVAAVAQGADEVQRRVEALHDAVDGIAERLGLDLEDQPAERSPVIAAALEAAQEAASTPLAPPADGDAPAITDPVVAAAIAAAQQAAPGGPATHVGEPVPGAAVAEPAPSGHAAPAVPPAPEPPLPAALQDIVSSAKPGGLIAPAPPARLDAPPAAPTGEPPADVPPVMVSPLPPAPGAPVPDPPPAAVAPPAPASRSFAPAGDGASDTARLVAVEMAVAGYPRAQVGERLLRQYGVSDPARILDEVFGRGTAGNSRMPWT